MPNVQSVEHGLKVGIFHTQFLPLNELTSAAPT